MAKSIIIPEHLGIIMDGNGRWAKERGKPRISGHKQGAKTVDNIVTACRKKKIKAVTLYAFSCQNWSRPSIEVKTLMDLLSQYLKSQKEKILKNNIRLTTIGQTNQLPEKTQKILKEMIDLSSKNNGMILCLALSYGGKEEVLESFKKIIKKIEEKELKKEDISLDTITKNTWSGCLGPVDLIIRTSGEQRLSNFLLWSSAYAELYFCNKYWPDFTEEDLDKALLEFASRTRRYGNIN